MEQAEKIALIRRLATDIYQALVTAPADVLTGPTACPGWDAGTVIAHLTGGAMRQHDSMLRGRDGHGGPPEGTGGPTTPDQVQQRNALSNRQFREELGDALLDRFRDVYATLDHLLQSWTDWNIGCWHHRRGTMTAGSYLDLRIQELVIHDWDMRSGGTGQAAMDAEGVIALLPGSEMWYDLCFRPTARLPRPVIYGFDVDGGAQDASLQHNVIVSGDSFRVMNPMGAHAADLTISCDAETYLLCLYGRVEWLAAKQEGGIVVTSPLNQPHDREKQETLQHDHLMRFHQWFGGL